MSVELSIQSNIICYHISEASFLVTVNTESDLGINITPCNSSNQGDIQLVGGRNEYEGRVEVCHNGEWKTVCDRGWGREEAEVVCRKLGYSNASNGNYHSM